MTEWRRIPSNPKYLVSDDGQIKHVNAASSRKFTKTAKGYFYVKFWQDRRERLRTVHALVAEAFIGPRPEGADIRHLDGNPSNNRVENLTYGSKKENMADRELHGRTRRGEKNGNSVLSDNDVICIRLIYAAKQATQYELAALFKASQAQINNIVLGKQRKRAA